MSVNYDYGYMMIMIEGCSDGKHQLVCVCATRVCVLMCTLCACVRVCVCVCACVVYESSSHIPC